VTVVDALPATFVWEQISFGAGDRMVKRRKKLHGTVKKVIKPVVPTEKEKAQIDVHEGDHLYREIRIDNLVTDENGQKSKLKEGEPVDLIVETHSDPNLKKPEDP